MCEKFKPGDRVELSFLNIVGYKGIILDIEYFGGDYPCIISIISDTDGKRYTFDCSFIGISLIKEENKQMKKSDLKNRMVVETRNGNRYMVVDNFLMRKDGYLMLSDYHEDLTMNHDLNSSLRELDIMKIYGPYETLADMNNVFAIEIWERDETKEIKFSSDLDFVMSVTDYLTAKKEHGDESAVIKFDLK